MSAPELAPLSARERFLRAARGQPVDRPPVWLMRQAGRYLPEYREIKSRSSFLEMCRDPGTATEVSLQPWRRFGMDGVVVFSDILVPLGGLDIALDFDPGPRVGRPVAAPKDLLRLRGDVTDAMAPTCEAIAALRRELGEGAAVIGFAGAPWTLAAYVSESRLSRDLEVLSALSWCEPGFVDELLERMVEVCAATLRVQIEAGADVVQIFDTWAGMLDVSRHAKLAGAALQRAIAALPARRPPVIVYARGAAHLADALANSGADVVSLDWRTDLGAAARRLGARVSLQGNLEPTALAAPPERIEREVARLIEAGRPARGHIVNLGHGVLPSIPVEGVGAFVRAVQESGA
jgi:uroporphyrinogen decarboxylase